MGRIQFPTPEEILRFVEESNAIEGIFVNRNHLLFTDHLDAVEIAIEAARFGLLLEPREIHEILMRSEPEKYPGGYRFGEVRIGNSTLLPARLVPVRMTDLLDRVRQGSTGDVEEWIWNVHFEFEHIHPFFDGNGRTGRIWMNAMRLIHGLSWLTITREERESYFKRIREYHGRTQSIWSGKS